MEIPFESVENAELIVDCIYKGGKAPDFSSEVISKLLPKCGIAGGFRKVMRQDNPKLPAYVVLVTTMNELEWPDFIDEETGVFRYYGDNRSPGKSITDTKLKGNALLEMVFSMLNEGTSLSDIPPFLVFKKEGKGFDVRFMGLAAPGNPKISPDKDLVAFWRTQGNKRFQNYESYFTILDTGKASISKKWLNELIINHDNSFNFAPDVWKKFVKKGRSGITPLMAPRIIKIPDKYYQLQSDVEGNKSLELIRNHYSDNPFGFEACAVDIICKMDTNFIDFNLTRPWRDGGRDAIGYYQISQNGKVNYPLKIDCALEAKCYSPDNAVHVKQMSRLISRIRYRQFGIMITTSYVDKQAYKEVVEDEHPILIVTASDIANILRNNKINSSDVEEWLSSIDSYRRA